MSKKSINFLLIAFILLSTSCKEISIYHTNIDIPNESWNLDSVAVFKINIDDTTAVHNIYVNIRNTNEYPNSNLFLFVQTISPMGSTLRDTLECILADNRGKWLGRGFGAIRDNQFPYKKYIRFPEKGTYTLSIQQGMRTSDIKGISSVGLRVERNND